MGLIGRNIQRSLSPVLQEDALRATGLSGSYRLMDTDLSGQSLGDTLRLATMSGFVGFNVTFPYKEEIIPLLDKLSPEARKIGAVNTVVVQPDKRLYGYNTDNFGFVRAFEEAFGQAAANDKTVVLVGAGGAGRAVAFALLELGVACLLIYDNDRSRAAQLVQDVQNHYVRRASVIEHLDECVAGADGVVNASPVGMRGVPGRPVPEDLIEKQEWVADVVYTPIETEFLKSAHAKGIAFMNGGGMCVHQAAQAFQLFTGRLPDVERMRRIFGECISAS
ncbi:MAG: shikimate dehydrogenase [Xanthobacteraceae bacterium]|nr:shikimate dehydrogenase [Xanthobacteraceae bacterium]MCW5675444.1 shikimate dehydrogenase [Xanthobacteraceae bacterium]